MNGRAIFCLTDHRIVSRVCQIRTGGGRVFINCDGKHGAVQVAVQSPEIERAARIHRKRETSQIGLPIAQRQHPSTPRATHGIFRRLLIATLVTPWATAQPSGNKETKTVLE
ncbi:hypothetical protein AEM42_12615 [Betaproteobacteria bacterium UKL13-2]|nr:hypothetical protein AEM42_12615 [Betaproteobacteria bacterium UKL13-2]